LTAWVSFLSEFQELWKSRKQIDVKVFRSAITNEGIFTVAAQYQLEAAALV